MQVEDLIQRQLEAYNRHDLDAFVSCYADDAVIRHADGRALMRGRAEISTRYERLFEDNPDLVAQVVTRIRVGEWIVDEEHVHLQDADLHVVVGYLVRSGLIRSVVMIRSDL